MKRFCLTPVEGKLLDDILAEYVVARQDRDRGKARLTNMMAYTGWKREFERNLANEELAVARETIRITTTLMHTLRRY